MKNKSWVVVLMAVAVTVVVACGDDGPVLPPDGPHPSIKNLTQREDVLFNIEAAYNKRRIDWYNGLLDANFSFYLAPSDVVGNNPNSWNRANEIDLNMRLFDRNYTALPCQSIFMDVRSEDGVSWLAVIPQSAPDEVWYQATLFYDFKFEISPNTYIPNNGSKAVFTVRNAGTNEKPHWQLVEMRDLGGSSLMSATAVSTEPTTWGGVKVMYR